MKWILFLISIDQISKAIARSQMAFGESLPLIRNVFHITLHKNSGAAFGLFVNHIFLLTLISFVFILCIGIYLFKNTDRKRESLALGLILSGAIGNFIDRICFGYVTDFLDFRIWPIFNFADCFITCGAALLVLFIFTGHHYDGRKSVR